MIEVYLPGTGGMKPLPNRFLTGLWAEHNGRALLIDCGEGMQVALSVCGRSLARLDSILITHFHADHIAGLPGLLLSAGNCGKTTPMDIYGPAGLAEVISRICCICGGLPFEVRIFEAEGEGTFPIGGLEIGGLIIGHMPVKHRIPCFCWSITEKKLPVFSPEKADGLGVPLNMRGRLHKGESIEINGRVITPDMVTEGERKPTKITYITDTLYFDGLARFAEGSDLLISEGMYGDDEYIPKMEEKTHMVFSRSAAIARDSGSGELWLTHFSPALDDPEAYIENARRIFPNTVTGRDGMHKTI